MYLAVLHQPLLQVVAYLISHAMLVLLQVWLLEFQVLLNLQQPLQSFLASQQPLESAMLLPHPQLVTPQYLLLPLLEHMKLPQLILQKNTSTGLSRFSHIWRHNYLCKIRFTLMRFCNLISILTSLNSNPNCMQMPQSGTNMIAPILQLQTAEVFRQTTEIISFAGVTVSTSSPS